MTTDIDAPGIDDPGDPRVALYRNLRDSDLRRSVEAQHGVFIAEGRRTVATAFESGWTVLSLLLTTSKANSETDLLQKAEHRGVPVYTAPPEIFDAIGGFHAHRGVLALAERRPLDPPERVLGSNQVVVIVEGVNDHENLGSIFRNAAALGAGAVLLDPASCDPLYRRSLRVSLGNVLRVPFTTAQPWPSALSLVKNKGFTIIALDPSAAVPLDDVQPSGRIALMVGSEGEGLSEAALGLADHRVRIPMVPGFDSLNVATALAIGLDRLGRQ